MFENIQPKFYVNVVETILMVVKSIDQEYEVKEKVKEKAKEKKAGK